MARYELRCEVTGAIASFKSADALPIDSLKVHFLPIQEGTGDPSPSNIRPITGWTGVNVYGDSAYPGLLNWNQLIRSDEGRTTTSITNDGHGKYYVTTEVTGSFNYFPLTAYSGEYVGFNIINGHKYCLLGNNDTSGKIRLLTSLSSDNAYADTGKGVIFTATSTIEKAYITTRFTTGTYTNVEFVPQLFDLTQMFGSGNEPSTVDEFREIFPLNYYSHDIGGTYKTANQINNLSNYFYSPISWSSLGTIYGGYVDLITGDVIAKWAGVATTWGQCTNAADMGSNITRKQIPMVNNLTTGSANNMCNIAPYGANENASTHFYYSGSGSTNRNARIFLPNDTPDSTEIVIITKLSDELQIGQLNPIQLNAFIGQNHIWSNANGGIECTYQFVDYLNLRRMSLNEPHMGMSGDPIAYFNTDLNSKLINIKSTFDPVQSGTGDPSPSNVRLITGWTGLNIHHTGQNLLNYNEITDTNVGTDINGDRKAVKFTKAGTYYVKSFSTWSSESYIYARVKNADDTFGNIIYVVAKTTVTNKTITITEGQTLYIFNASSGVYGTTEATIDRFNGWGIVVSLEDVSEYIPYSGETYSVSFPAQGKNLVPLGTVSFTQAKKCTFNKLPAGTYTISFTVTSTDADSSYCLVRFWNGDTAVGSEMNFQRGSRNTRTFTIGSEFDSIYLYASDNWARGAGDTATYTDIQLESGSTATAYEPYTNTIYGGYVDLISGEFIKTYEIVDLGTLNYTYDSTNFQFVCYNGINFTERTSMMCSNYKNSPVSQWTSMEDKTFSGHPTDGTVFRIKDTDYTDATTFKAAMSGVKLVYKLNTPVTIAAITPIEIKALRGQNYIWADTNGETTVKYWTHIY